MTYLGRREPWWAGLVGRQGLVRNTAHLTAPFEVTVEVA